jgi:hypothetical protein
MQLAATIVSHLDNPHGEEALSNAVSNHQVPYQRLSLAP